MTGNGLRPVSDATKLADIPCTLDGNVGTTGQKEAHIASLKAENSTLHIKLGSVSAQLAAAQEAAVYFRGLFLAHSSRLHLPAFQLAKPAHQEASAERQAKLQTLSAAQRLAQERSTTLTDAEKTEEAADGAMRHTQSAHELHEAESRVQQLTSLITSLRAQVTQLAAELNKAHAASAQAALAFAEQSAQQQQQQHEPHDKDMSNVDHQSLPDGNAPDVGSAAQQASSEPANDVDSIPKAAGVVDSNAQYDAEDEAANKDRPDPVEAMGAAGYMQHAFDGANNFSIPSLGSKRRTMADTTSSTTPGKIALPQTHHEYQIPALHLRSDMVQQMQMDLTLKNDMINKQAAQITQQAVKMSGQKLVVQQLQATIKAWELPALLFDVRLLMTKVHFLMLATRDL